MKKHCTTCTCVDNPHERLRPRDRDVLSLAVKGYTQKEIAAALDVEVRAVKSHLTRMFRLFGIQNGCKVVKLVRLCYEDQRILG